MAILKQVMLILLLTSSLNILLSGHGHRDWVIKDLKTKTEAQGQKLVDKPGVGCTMRYE